MDTLPNNSAVIDLSTSASVAHWMNVLDCTETQLYAAVATAGSQAADVRKQLKSTKMFALLRANNKRPT